MKYVALVLFLMVGDHDETFTLDRFDHIEDCNAALHFDTGRLVDDATRIALIIEATTGKPVGFDIGLDCIVEAAI